MRIVFYSILSLSLIAVFLCAGFYLFLTVPLSETGSDLIFIVHDGANLGQVAGDLEDRRIIFNRSLFMLWAMIRGESRAVKSGEYRLSPRMTPEEILKILTKGIIITHPVTIPEGFTRKQISDLLEENGILDGGRFFSLTNDSSPLQSFGVSGPSLEGYLYPDTYHFGRGISPQTAVNKMIERFWQVVGPLKNRMEAIGMTLEEVVTLASIVEKETGKAHERPIIASVFLNRLKRRMRLESDPTVIYGLKDFDGNLTRKDLKHPTPYNTYVINGIPPGPIANPGIEAIKAVLYPAKTDYLFFVSKNDGTHHFSKTISEHNRAVNQYQKRRTRKKRKTS
jgi:UPF0755 protein